LKQRTHREIVAILLVSRASDKLTFKKTVRTLIEATSTVSEELGRPVDNNLVNYDEKRSYTINKRLTIRRSYQSSEFNVSINEVSAT